ncbi:non-ribosomal peptide synthetase [Nonomuraea soli]|uniref:Amino acid adenylation domain-containing protein/thioester reductase-like protein n=1 Tax=Nonomuraea soli TaxID=1032476 RepID=A0A7W0CKN8_9ACTN|nr:non-ribosomal peptide synthetase [Nonomuraea soli]MBA2892923.1 amino acid adenylation domain-containing protein/thioester reductase-like protein [Nonomuraea soli]
MTTVVLSPEQERLWFLQQAGLGGEAYLVWAAHRLSGALDVPLLGQAVGALVERHPALRTAVAAGADGRPEGRVCPAVDVPFEVAPPATEEEARQLVDAFVAEPFSLARAPLVRVLLVPLGEGEHILALAAHHLACDGPSLEVLVDELYRLYGGETLPPPPAVSPQPGDPEAERAYWRERLAGAPAVLDLPLDRPRQDRPGSRGARHVLPLPQELVDGLAVAAKETRTSAFMLVLAAVAVVLGRFADEEDVVVGSPVSNREHPGAVGMFVNTLALRADLGGDPTLGELVRQVRRTVLGALTHRRLPFDEVVELSGVARDLRHNPLFQVMLVVDLPGEGVRDVPGLEVAPYALPAPAARFDLTVVASLGATGTLAFDYAAELFDEATVARMAEHLVSVLGALAGERDRRLGELTFPGSAPSTWPHGAFAAVEPVHEQFARRAAADPLAPALIGDGPPLAYGTLERRANHLAHRLRALGVTAGETVAVLLPAGADALVAILGVLRAGGAYVPLDPGQPAARLADLIADAGCRAVIEAEIGAAIGAEIGGDNGAEIGAAIGGEAGTAITVDDREAAHPPPPAAADLAYVIYTSGSTGRPKGVAVTHDSLARLTEAFRDVHDCFAPGQRVLMIPPLTFDASAGDLFPALTGGAALVVHPDPAELDGPGLVDFCARHGVTAVDTASALWRKWTEELGPVPADWPVTTMMVGGERVPADSLRAWARKTGGKIAFYNHYGPTEATVCATVHRTVDGGDTAVSLPIGRPLPHVRAHVLDRHGRRVPTGVRGELHLGGPCLARGYVGSPELTRAAFVPDPFSGGLMYRTGDLVRQDADGVLHFLGRADRQIKLRGRRIEPGEVESALAAHPAVRDSAVVARDELLIAYVTGHRTGDLRDFLRERLPGHLVPAAFVWMDTIPLTAHGKVDEAALPAPVLGAAVYEPPSGRIERVLAGIWERRLGAERVGRHDGFFEAGGHSLLAASVVADIERELGARLPIAALFAARDLATLAASLTSNGPASTRVGPDSDRVGPDSDRAELAADLVVPADIRPGPSRTGPPRRILLTGATGFLGPHVLEELSRHDGLRVRCLTLDGTAPGGTEAVRGDLTRPLLGLPPSAFEELAEETDLVVHLARQVSFVLPYGRLRAVNVTGMAGILRLAATGPVTPVHTVSTLGVFLGHPGTVTERSVPGEPRSGGYYLSRWAGERLAITAGERGLPVTLHRPARVGPHSRTGRWSPGDHLARMIIASAQLGLVPDLAHEEDLLPADHLAQAVVRHALAGSTATLHHFNGLTVGYPQIAAVLTQAGAPVDLVPWHTWLAAARGRTDLAVTPLLPSFTDEPPPARRPRFDCRATLAATGLPGPPSARDLLALAVERFAADGLLERVPSCRG